MSEPKDRTIAVVGASADRAKYGNKCVRAYRQAGWTVYPIHPTETSIEGLPAYPSVAAAPRPVGRISLYLPPARTESLLADLPAGPEIFFNPGTAGPELLDTARSRGLRVRDACSIVAIGSSPGAFPD